MWHNRPMVMFDPYTRPPPSAHRITILGGTGFVGHHLVSRLSEDGHRIKVLSRNREAHRDMLVDPNVEVVTANVYDPQALERNFEDVDAVINLVGILNEKGHKGAGFQRTHVELTRAAANAAKKAGVRRFIQMSALGAALDSASHYQRTKAEAEKVLKDEAGALDVTIFRPSTMFGEHDTFINRFAKLLGRVPVAFPLACAGAKFAPVYVKDVVEAYARALDNPKSHGRTYELCGPDVLTLQEIVEYVRDLQRRRKPVVPLPDFLSKAQAYVFEFVPGKPFSLDNYRSMLRDSVCGGENGLGAFDIQPTGMEAVVPWYMTPRRSRRIYDKFRRRAGGYPRP
ncbi:MAG TPA: complex I NDUFA9 subunit family protein [Gammaproteobacteria bacterium]